MKTFQDLYLLRESDYGILLPYILSKDITDINWNGNTLWIDHLQKGRYITKETLTKEFVIRFSSLIAHVVSLSFNKVNPILEAETEELRISIVHESVANTGTAISIRKIPAIRRIEESGIVESGYCNKETEEFLKNCVQAHYNIAICGMPGAGKTELLKYLTKYIPDNERAITIEDTLEIHYSSINPDKDCIEMKVTEQFTYTDAIKSCLRQLPKWIILSEARSAEVRYLLECLSTGTYGMTTLHTDDVRNIPDRVKNMAGGHIDSERILNDTFTFLNIGILVRCQMEKGGRWNRRIEQVCLFERKGRSIQINKNSITMIVENGEFICKQIPASIIKRFTEEGI